MSAPTRADRYSAEWRQRVSHGSKRGKARAKFERERARERAQIRPRDLARWEELGLVEPSLLPLVQQAQDEVESIVEALGGADRVSPQRRVLIEDFCRLGIAVRGVTASYLRTADHELASKIGTLTGQRRTLLESIGLERIAKEVELADRYAIERVKPQDAPAPAGASIADGATSQPSGSEIVQGRADFRGEAAKRGSGKA